MLRKLIIIILLSVLYGQAVSAMRWGEVSFNYVQAVAMFWDGTNNVLAVTLTNPVTTGCAVTNNNRTVHHWVQGAPFDSAVSSWISTALAAQAQGKQVEIVVDDAVCDPAYGRRMLGIKMHK